MTPSHAPEPPRARELWVHCFPGMDGPETYYEPMNHCPTRRHNKDGCPKCIRFREVLPAHPPVSKEAMEWLRQQEREGAAGSIISKYGADRYAYSREIRYALEREMPPLPYGTKANNDLENLLKEGERPKK